ncbi:hypothetical protein GQ457_16G014600 [Hibiscus cannabinus]
MEGLCGLSYVGKVEQAHEMLMNMEKKESIIRPDIYSYTTIMDDFCKVGRSDEAMELHKQALVLGTSYSTFLNGLLKWGKIKAALKVYKEMMGIGFEVEGR